ncbi:MAG: DUF6270 domain-containing protein [Gulosibacter sp.]|uniref:DUF6270 domain-containing protein n=1 Tax=Gulosibacter sp. TaxID=2817531 RepID=UPI003F92018F
MNPSRPVAVTIFGSCVSRDTLETMDRTVYPILAYVSRQSLLTAGTDASAHLPEHYTTSNRFQLRNVRRDIEGHQLDTIVAAGEPEVLLWDLVDERHGIFEFGDGAVITRSVDVLGVPEFSEATEAARVVRFGSDEHFNRWTDAAQIFLSELDALGYRDRVLVLAVNWAAVDVEGMPTPLSMGKSSGQANSMFARYYAYLEELGLPVFRIDDAVADPDHRWGPAPFHYTSDVYARIHEAIDEHVRQRRG